MWICCDERTICELNLVLSETSELYDDRIIVSRILKNITFLSLL